MSSRDDFIARDLPPPEFIEGLMRAQGIEVQGTRVLAGMRLLLVASNLRSAMEAEFASEGISIARMQLLVLLLRSEGHRAAPSRLAERAGVSTATITGVVDTLERQGFVRREAHGADRRRRDVVLTDEGRGFLARLAPRQAKRLRRLLGRLGDADIPVLHDLLDRLDAGIEDMRAAATVPEPAEEG
ncbi:MAG: MarR family transcriptional regulator [Deltaproteobacteria bacterium]|nr:MarR family transcriptional regulator [Deltaproteobacteria bacterium]